MKNSLRFRLFAILLSLITINSFSQSSLYVSSGANFMITSGTVVFIDSIVLTPSADFNITGLNSLTRDVVAIPPPPTTYIDRVYRFLSTLPAYSGDVGIYYQDSELNGIDENTLTLNNYDGIEWTAYNIGVTRDPVNNFVTTAGLINLFINQATLATNVVVPVTLSRFTIQNNSCVASLDWSTTTEQNSKHFEVQHSMDGIYFKTIGIVKSQGNSNTGKRYSFNSNLSVQNNYFRLLMVDIDGRSQYSSILSVQSDCHNTHFTLYPNPAKNNVTIKGIAAGNHLRILDNTGKIVNLIKAAGSSESINISNLAAGTYIIQVIHNNKVLENLKLVRE